MTITQRDARFQRLEALKTNRARRLREGLLFVEGVRNINTALGCGWECHSLLYAAGAKHSAWAQNLLDTLPTQENIALAPDLMAALSAKDEPSELLALFAMRRYDEALPFLGENPLLALFDRPSNHGNLGTVLRSCDALGVEALLTCGHGVDPYAPEVIAASMGSYFSVPLLHLAGNERVLRTIDMLRGRYPGFSVVGTTAHDAKPVETVDLTGPTLFILGNETDGMSRLLRETCDIAATIPMAQGSAASSFNVGCAATVLFYEAMRQRRNATG